MNATGATKCIVVHGQMRILAHPADSLSFAVAGLRTGLRDALVAGRDVGQKGEISNVAFLSYLGDTKKEALVEYGGGGGNTGSGITAALGGNDSGGSRPIGLVLGICVPLVAALLAAAIVKRKRSLADSAPAVWQDPNQTQPKTSGALVGTGDPPGSFHDGIYHYMKNGQRYLSTQCEKCLETKRNGIYSVEMFDSNTFAADKMKSILEFGTDDGGDILARADSSLGLSQHHMGIDVHKCQSALCKRCVPDSPQTTFVPVLSSTQDSRSIPSNLESLTRLDSRLTLLTQKMHNKELEEDLPDLPPIAVVTSPAVHDIQSASCSTISTGLGSSISVSTFGGNSSIFTDALSTKSKRAKGYFSLMD